jgi:AraC-like DNA-binding protein
MPQARLVAATGALVSGCYGRSFDIDTRQHASVVGVHFRPGCAAGVLGIPPGELADAHCSLDELWGRAASELRERLAGTCSSAARFAILEHTLRERLDVDARRRRLVSAALPELEQPRREVGDVARELGLSKRRFIEVFTAHVGMAPKRYARVRRFQRALALSAGASPVAWAQVAHAAGYFDQSHLCRDWRDLMGLSPTTFFALRATAVKDSHVALPDEGSTPSKTPGSRRT